MPPRSLYDPDALTSRAEEWRVEATEATIEAMRTYCQAEAAKCEQMVLLSRCTPVLAQAPEPRAGSAGD
jgi:hypothetical protein